MDSSGPRTVSMQILSLDLARKGTELMEAAL